MQIWMQIKNGQRLSSTKQLQIAEGLRSLDLRVLTVSTINIIINKMNNTVANLVNDMDLYNYNEKL